MTPLEKITLNILLVIIQLHLALCHLSQQDLYRQNYNRLANLYANQCGGVSSCNTYGNLNPNLYGEVCGNPTCSTCGANCNSCDNTCDNPLYNCYGNAYDNCNCGNPTCNLYNSYGNCGNPSCYHNSGCGTSSCYPYNGCGSPGCYPYNGCGNSGCYNSYSPYGDGYPYSCYGYGGVVQPEAACQPANNQPVIIINGENDGDSSDFQNSELFALLLSTMFNNNNNNGAPNQNFGGCNGGGCGNNNNCCCNCGCCCGNGNNNNNCNNGGSCNNNGNNCSPAVQLTIIMPKSDESTGKPSITIS